ncbi:hypothetical protein D9757_003308 [Collybiopsis confluens]|uniref:Uncharacterized protein n=1 Tax=Collybiopsis confluens TaxID=2823264 RepID=A0A8H5HYM0_9AGAR|nr:hypothetical protein D9757_003308 [Collybiopsis confluens]
MDPSAAIEQHKEPRKALPRKRSFGKYPSSKVTDSPAYDASEEDNDPTDVDDATSAMSIPAASSSSRTRTLAAAGLLKGSGSSPVTRRHHLAASFLSDSDGVDSPTYDGDIESSTTAGPESPHIHPSSLRLGHHHSMSSTSTLNTPALPGSGTTTDYIETPGSEVPSMAFPPSGQGEPVLLSSPSDPYPVSEPAVPSSIPDALSFNPAALKPEDIQDFVQKAINGGPVEGSGAQRAYKINQPPENRAVRIYADGGFIDDHFHLEHVRSSIHFQPFSNAFYDGTDLFIFFSAVIVSMCPGVYDLFHFGHALQLRQAKLSFPSVYLLVGVCSDELVGLHKAKAIMSHGERMEAVRHCRWVDQVVPEAPWVVTPDFLARYRIDYIAHDEDPYKAEGLGHDDVYAEIKQAGKFRPVFHSISRHFKFRDRLSICIASQSYGTEKAVGLALKDSGLKREEVFITTKLPMTDYDRVQESFSESLTNLDLDYVDLYLLHFPQCVVAEGGTFARNADGTLKTVSSPTFVEVWSEIEKIFEQKKAKAIGVSNFSIKNLEILLKKAKVVPAVNQVELHPYLFQPELRKYCKEKEIAIQAYAPSGYDTVRSDPVITEVSKRVKASPNQVILAWHLAKETLVVPKSVKEDHQRENFNLPVLAEEDVKKIDALDRGQRLCNKPDAKGFVWGWTMEQLGW